MRPYTARMTPPFTMIGGAVGVVEQSKNPEFPVGCTIIHTAGWVERGVVNPDKMGKASPSGKLGGVKKAVDMGNLVGQIAKNMGCRVIGFAGTDEKCAWLKTIGFDEAFNYKKTGVSESLAKAAPHGVDCYFDNVGGEMTAAVMAAMNTRGRVAVCGAISHYNEVGGYSKVTDVLPLCVFKELKVEGFLVGRWADRWMEGVSAMAGMVMKGDIKVQETVIEGFEKMPEALMGLFTGVNTGKMIVKA